MTDLEIMQILIKAKELGITANELIHWKTEQTKPVDVPDLKSSEIIVPVSPFDDLSEDEILYWHSPFYDDIQTKKEAQKQKLAENIND